MSRATPTPAQVGDIDNSVVIYDRTGAAAGTASNPFVTGGKSSSTLTATQVTVPATADGILILAANAARLGGTISNPSAVTVYVSSAATGLTTSNGYGIPAGGTLNIGSPLYTGALYGIVAAATQVVTAVEWS